MKKKESDKPLGKSWQSPLPRLVILYLPAFLFFSLNLYGSHRMGKVQHKCQLFVKVVFKILFLISLNEVSKAVYYEVVLCFAISITKGYGSNLIPYFRKHLKILFKKLLLPRRNNQSIIFTFWTSSFNTLWCCFWNPSAAWGAGIVVPPQISTKLSR